MKRHLILGLLAVAAILAGAAESKAAAICPTTVNTNTDCGYIITVDSAGNVTGAGVTGALPYDGSDDALIGVVNNSSAPFQSVTLSGSGNGGGIFAFDFDGICTLVTGGCSYTAPTGYEGPLNTFVNINSAEDSGTVLFSGTGLAPGATTYFSLESSPASINGGGSIIVPTVPEPATIVILAFGLAVVITSRRYYI